MRSRLHRPRRPSLNAMALALWLAGASLAIAAEEAPVEEGPQTTVAASTDRSSRMGVPVFVNGQGPYRFIVDTGSDRTVVSERLAASLGLPVAGVATMHSFAGESRIGLVRINKLNISTREVPNLVAAALKEEHLGAEGLLGIDSLSRQRITLDFRANLMTVGPGQRRPPTETRTPEGAEVIVVRGRVYAGQLVLTDAQIGGVRVRVVIDTGAASSVGNLELRRQLVRRRAATPSMVEIRSVDGKIVTAEMAIVPELSIGSLKLRNLPIAFVDAHPFRIFHLDDTPALLLGMDVMSIMDEVSVDFASRTVRFVLAREEGDL